MTSSKIPYRYERTAEAGDLQARYAGLDIDLGIEG